ncbi:MAG: hypothetical protein HY431_02880 [Candidatus Levybacteria bacterium]|nr:hypothetical protein [Candidatus Levybacteria bacterium]
MAKTEIQPQRWYHPDELAAAMRAEYGLAPDPALSRYNDLYYQNGRTPAREIDMIRKQAPQRFSSDGHVAELDISQLDMQSGENDALFLGMLSSSITLEQKLQITSRLFEAVFHREKLPEEKSQPQWNYKFFPGLWLESDSMFCQSFLTQFPEGKGEVMSPGFVESWQEQKRLIDENLDGILKNRTPAFLVMHSVTASLGMLSLAERPKLLSRPDFHVVMINPDSHPKERTNYSKTLRERLARIKEKFPRVTDEWLEKFLLSFPQEWDENIQEAFREYGRNKNISIIVGEDDDIVPPSALGDKKTSNIFVIPQFGHMDGKNSQEVLTKVQEIMHAATAEQKPPLDQDRVGAFLRTATELYKNEKTPQELKDAFYQCLTPQVLEEIAKESSAERWSPDNTEAALHAYCEFMTIERRFGEEKGQEIYRKLAKMFITARELDVWGNRVGKVTTGEKRGTAIYLSPKGQDMAECISQLAFTQTREEMEQLYGENEGFMSGYYRNWDILTNLGDELADPKGRLVRIDQALAELARVKGGLGGEGIDLPAKGHVVDKDGKITVSRGTANVGGHVVDAVGYANGLRWKRIQRDGIIYDKPERAEKYREVQLDYSGAAGLIIAGDGALHHVNAGLEYASLYNSPAIFLLMNNLIAIGAKLPEYTAQTELWQKGHGRNVPGIRIEKTDPDQLFMAMRFAVLRAYHDGGPTLIEAMVARLDAHSIQHGDVTTVEYIFEAKEILERQLTLLPNQDPKRDEIRKYIDTTLTKYSQSVNQLTVVERLVKLLAETEYVSDKGVRIDIQKIIDEIVDPAAVALETWQDKGYITPQEEKQWKSEEKTRLAAITEEVLARPRPDPKKATMDMRFPARKIERKYSTEKRTVEGNSEALSLATCKALENPHFLAGGIDLVKGLDIHDGKFVYAQGYYREIRNSYERFGHIPMKVFNMPIDEANDLKFAMGMATTRTDPESIKKALRIGLFLSYGDYAYEAIAALHILANRYYSTGGELTNLVTLVMNSGAVAGGGFMHSHEMAAKMYQTNHSVNIAYVSDPESTYKVGNYVFNESNNPNILIIDKKKMFEPTATFEEGTGVIEPGEGRLVKEGNGTQIISFGPMVNTFKDALESSDMLPRFTESTGLYDLRWIQPFAYDGLADFLADGTGPIIVAHEEPIGVTPSERGSSNLEPIIKGFGAQIISLLATDPQMREIIQGRPIIPFGSKPVPAPPCDGILMDAVIPTVKDAKRALVEANRLDRESYLRAEAWDRFGHDRDKKRDRHLRSRPATATWKASAVSPSTLSSGRNAQPNGASNNLGKYKGFEAQ